VACLILHVVAAAFVPVYCSRGVCSRCSVKLVGYVLREDVPSHCEEVNLDFSVATNRRAIVATIMQAWNRILLSRQLRCL
jgi:hypothetical protein